MDTCSATFIFSAVIFKIFAAWEEEANDPFTYLDDPFPYMDEPFIILDSDPLAFLDIGHDSNNEPDLKVGINWLFRDVFANSNPTVHPILASRQYWGSSLFYRAH